MYICVTICTRTTYTYIHYAHIIIHVHTTSLVHVHVSTILHVLQVLHVLYYDIYMYIQYLYMYYIHVYTIQYEQDIYRKSISMTALWCPVLIVRILKECFSFIEDLCKTTVTCTYFFRPQYSEYTER